MEAADLSKYVVTICEATECVVLNERRVHFHRCEKKCHIGAYKFRFLCQKVLKIFIKVFIFMQFINSLNFAIHKVFFLRLIPRCRWVSLKSLRN
jgi:hypothetical protein